jgi:RNA polymerase sigma factor CnrH
VQETFLRAFRLLARLERRESFGSFAAGIAVRVCADWRKASARGEVALEGEIAAAAEPDRDAGHDRLHAAIRALPELYRDVIALCYFADRSYREIAAALGLTESAVNARLAKARSLLRESLAGGGG